MVKALANHAHPRRTAKLAKGELSTLIVDDHFVTRLGIKQLLTEEFRGITFGEAATKSEALEAIDKRAWHAVTLEINIPGNRGLHLLEELLRRQPDAQVLVLTVHPEWQYARKALSLGALAYLTKDSPRLELVKGFSRLLAAKRHVDRASQSVPAVIPVTGNLHETLSSQEYKVGLALASGKRPGQVAAELQLSIKTVSTYKSRILKKMQMNNSADLVRYAIDHQLL